MAIAYDGINYFPVGVNFMEENAMEVIEAKYGIKGWKRQSEGKESCRSSLT